MSSTREESNTERHYLRNYYARALTHWGVVLQRAGSLTNAAPAFQLALRLNPNSDQARANLEFNAELGALNAGKSLTVPDFNQLPPLRSGFKTWDDLLLMNGPFDSPVFTAQISQVFSQGGNYRQSLAELQRLHTLFPTNQVIKLWRGYVQGMARFGAGDAEGSERDLVQLRDEFPDKSLPHFALSQFYLARGDFDKALPEVEKQLTLNPTDRDALLNTAVIAMAKKDYAKVIGVMDRLLGTLPDYPPALMNRAIANLQLGNLDAAERDYNALLKPLPKMHTVQYGLAEVAARRNDIPAAIRHWERYLETAPKGTGEFQTVEKRLAEANGGQTR